MSRKLDVTIEKAELEVHYDYDPGEAEERYDSNMTGRPATPPSVTVNKVVWYATRQIGKPTRVPVDVTELMEQLNYMDVIETECYERND